MNKIITLFLGAIFLMSMSSCTENYSNGTRIGTINKFSKTGFWWKSWEGHMNLTQTGMTSTAADFEFSIDNDNEPEGLAKTLDSAMNYGWKVELTYHEVQLKNWFSNRGGTDHFVTYCKVIDRGFSNHFGGSNTPGKSDTLVMITIPIDSARKLGWIK